MATPSESRGSAPMSMSPADASYLPVSKPIEERDDDDISLTSTVESEPQDEYEVETIYAQEIRYGVKTYLVKWKGYSDLRCTWEPVSSFNGNDCLKDWRKKQRAIQQGLQTPFDVEAWEANLEAFEDARDERKRRRREKRARLGLLESEEERQESGELNEPDQNLPESNEASSSDDIPFLQNRPPSQLLLESNRLQPSKEQGRPDKTTSTPDTTTRRVERPRLAAPEPVGITIMEGRTERRNLSTISQRAKEQQKSSAKEYKTWKLFSTTNKFAKASRADHEPDPSQLELQRPGEWTPFQMSSILRGRQPSTNDSLFVEQDDGDNIFDSAIPNDEASSMPLIESNPQNPVDVASNLQSLNSPLLDSDLSNSVGVAPDLQPSNSPVQRTQNKKLRPGPRSLRTSSGTYNVGGRELSKKEDLLCRLTYGPDQVEVGEVSLCDFSESARRTVFRLRKAREIHISFDELCSLEQYQLLTKEVGNDIQFNGCVTAYTDTQAKLCAFNKLLLEKDLVAISRVNNEAFPRYSVTLLCYPAKSKSFQFLNRYSYSAPEGSLRIAGKAGILPHLSQARLRRSLANDSDLKRPNRLARPEREGRFQESMDPGVEGFLSRKFLSQDMPSTPRLGMKSLSTQPTPSPLKVRKIVKTPVAASSRSGDKSGTFSRLPSINDKDISTISALNQPEKMPSRDSDAMDITPSTYSVNGKDVVADPVPRPAVIQDVPSTEIASPDIERSDMEPSRVPNDKRLAEPSTLTLSISSISAQSKPKATLSVDSDAMDVTHDTPPDSEDISQAITEASKKKPSEKGLEDNQDQEMLDAGAMENVDVKDYIKKAFPEAFKVEFANLAAVTIHGRTKLTNCFYLYFPEEANGDFQVLEHYLDSHLAIVLSNRRSNDWEKFTKSQSGVALFHHSFMQYHALPGLHRLTRNTSFNFWNVSLNGNIPNIDQEVHFQRLFPHGAGFLMTEDFMRHELDAAIIIIAWFRDNAYSKLLGSYRMMFRPDIMNWLESMSEKDPRFAVMAVLIGDIACRGDSLSWPTEPSDLDQFANPLLQSPVVSLQDMSKYGYQNENKPSTPSDATTQEQRDADYLCEIFSAWALLNAASMRRFCIITHDEPRDPWRSWTHLEACRGPDEFYQRWGVNKDSYKKWLAQYDSPPSSPKKPLGSARWDPTSHKIGSPTKSGQPKPSSNEVDTSK